MGYSNRDEEEMEFRDYLKQLIDFGKIEGSALGITKLVIDKGRDVLSTKQEYVFKTEVIDTYTIERCRICSSNITWSEMLLAVTEDGLCSYCRHNLEKDD